VADGRILYEVRASASKGVLYVRDPDGRRVGGVRAVRGVRDAVFSPQGRRIAFAARGRIWIMQADGADVRRVTATRSAGEPTWSPAGDALAFAGGRRGRRDIFRVGAAGGAAVRLTSSRADERSPAWGADGRLVFVRRTRLGGDELYLLQPATGAARRLTRSRADEGAPSWSPDARQIAFTRRRASGRDVYVMNADGSEVRRLTTGQRVSGPAWSPDGRSIAFAMRRRGQRQLFVMTRDGQELTQLMRSPSAPRAPTWEPAAADPVIAAAGDIACEPADPRFRGGNGTPRFCRQRHTSDLLLGMDLAAVLVLGDAQYADTTLPKFRAGFDPSWGRVRSLLRPAPGNHEYRTPGAAGYFDYFNGPGRFDGPAGPRDRGYYSFDLGDWHVVALNSQCSHPPRNPTLHECAQGSAQERWLREDLAAHARACTLAFWHHPTAASGIGVNPAVDPLFKALYDYNVDLLLTGHDHAYERFAPQAPGHVVDTLRGIREFVVGTGGKSLQGARILQPGSEVRGATFGVLRVTLRAGGYDWAFVPEAGATFTDSGSAACH
ncbi:MAG: metallophosphoesterase, partial [Actinomycetota bacterium]|nr:metallophosphoesterase [Actinomycetota bacterium]